MKEVDNFDAITPYLKFGDNAIILVWLVLRNKDVDAEIKGSNKNRTIKSYHFQSLEQLNQKKDEIIALCKFCKCRAYICVNPKPLVNVLFTLQSIVMQHIKECYGNTRQISLKGMIDSAIMKSGTSGDKLWVIDVDTLDEKIIQETTDCINKARSGFDVNVVTKISTVHGVHLITHPFDLRNLPQEFEVKKEGLTLLYAFV